MQEESEKIRAIQEFNAGLIGCKIEDAIHPNFYSVDISKPNEHDTKKEFTAELKAVEAALKHLSGLLALFATRNKTPEPTLTNLSLRLAIDEIARKDVFDYPIEDTADLIHLNMINSGFSYSLIISISRTMLLFQKRYVQLLDQKIEFWSLGHRAPNYYARTIALRVARFYCQETQERPTFGTASEGGHPSTAFAKAIEQIFRILEIECDIRGPIEWALAQLTEDDLESPMNALQRFYPKKDKKKSTNSAVVNALVGYTAKPDKGHLK